MQDCLCVCVLCPFLPFVYLKLYSLLIFLQLVCNLWPRGLSLHVTGRGSVTADLLNWASTWRFTQSPMSFSSSTRQRYCLHNASLTLHTIPITGAASLFFTIDFIYTYISTHGSSIAYFYCVHKWSCWLFPICKVDKLVMMRVGVEGSSLAAKAWIVGKLGSSAVAWHNSDALIVLICPVTRMIRKCLR